MLSQFFTPNPPKMRYIRQNQILVKKKNDLIWDFTRRACKARCKSQQPCTAPASLQTTHALANSLFCVPPNAALPPLSIRPRAAGPAISFRYFPPVPSSFLSYFSCAHARPRTPALGTPCRRLIMTREGFPEDLPIKEKLND